MGLQIGDIVPRTEIKLSELKGKVIAVDAFNAIYQFLSSIRQQDGTPLMDSNKKITSHLSGLFNRNMALLAEGIKLIYVFDGEYNVLKSKTHELRYGAKLEMQNKYEQAVEEEDIDSMYKYSRGFTKLDSEMLAESKETFESYGNSSI
jgi:flap endonuclease-1